MKHMSLNTKKISQLKLIIMCIIVVFSSATVTNAQSLGTSMVPILRDAVDYIGYIEDDLNQEIVRIEFDILRDSKTTIRTLSSDYTYGIYAFGDYSMADIDVKVYRKSNGSWNLVKSDTDTDKTAMVIVSPMYTGEYKIEISCYRFKSGYEVGHYGLIIFHE